MIWTKARITTILIFALGKCVQLMHLSDSGHSQRKTVNEEISLKKTPLTSLKINEKQISFPSQYSLIANNNLNIMHTFNSSFS